MALFKSATMTQASGSVGGVTYSHTSSGMYMRARSIPVNPNTTFQANIRAGFTAAVNKWTEVLTPAQRAGWDLYAANVPRVNALGSTFAASGQNNYVAAQSVIEQVNQKLALSLPNIFNAPALFNRGDFTTPTAIVDFTSGIAIDFEPTDAWAGSDNSTLLIFQGRPQNPSRNYYRGPWRLIGGIVGDSAAAPTSPFTITPAQIALRGYPYDINQRVNITVALIQSDGRLSSRRNLGNILSVT